MHDVETDLAVRRCAAAHCALDASLIAATGLQVVEIMSNEKLSERYLALARDLDVMEAKLPEDVYKMHLVDTHRSGLPNPTMESGMKNLSDSLVNALLNLGFGTDKLVTVEAKEGEKSWVARNKQHGKSCAVASIGVRAGTPSMCIAIVRTFMIRCTCTTRRDLIRASKRFLYCACSVLCASSLLARLVGQPTS